MNPKSHRTPRTAPMSQPAAGPDKYHIPEFSETTNTTNITTNTTNTTNTNSGGLDDSRMTFSSRPTATTTATHDSLHRADYPTFIMLVDIDGTIIGDIDPQLTEYELIIQGSSRKQTQKNLNSFRGRNYKNALVTQLMNGLMRPGFALFCAQCALLRIPIMLYTAAEHEWATFLAPRILQAVRFEMMRNMEDPPLNFRFARLFTRRYCGITSDGSCRKSLDLIIKHVYASLKKEYTMSRGLEGLMERIVMIDNTEGILEQKRNLVLVPTYEYSHMYDVTANIDSSDSKRLHRARQMLTDETNSFLGPTYSRELLRSLQRVETQTNFKSQAFRSLFFNTLSKAIMHNAVPVSSGFYHGNDPLWRTLRSRLVTFMRTDSHQQYNAYDLAKFLAGHMNLKMLTKDLF